MRFRKTIVGLTAAAAIALPASAAFAGGTPTPTPVQPTISPNFGYSPPPTPRPVFRNWQFDLQLSNIGAVAVNNVEGFGAIPMAAWTDTQLSPTLDKFSRGANFVVVRHAALPFPFVNLRTCTLEFNQTARFHIVASGGTAAGAVSRNGQYVLQGLLSFPYVSKYRGNYGNGAQVCPLRFVNLFALLYALQNNSPTLPGNLPAPTFNDFGVQGDAQVSLNAVPTPPIVTPSPTPTYPTPTGTYPTHT